MIERESQTRFNASQRSPFLTRSSGTVRFVDGTARSAMIGVFSIMLGCGGKVEISQGLPPGTGGNPTTSMPSSSTGGSITATATGGTAATGGSNDTGGTSSGDVCSGTECEDPMCPPKSAMVTFFGDCCPGCQAIDASCAKVICAVLVCPKGFARRREPGACCDTCEPLLGASYFNCEAADCIPTYDCPLGYAPTYPSLSCCNPCEPDPNFCVTDDDCIIATRISGCTGCPRSISKRLYADDVCYSSVDVARSTPDYCPLQYTCDMPSSGGCNFPQFASCQNHTCVAVFE